VCVCVCVCVVIQANSQVSCPGNKMVARQKHLGAVLNKKSMQCSVNRHARSRNVMISK
jgi:hypothetical protein